MFVLQIMPPVIDLDDHRFYRSLTLSCKLSAKVLRKVIEQYCIIHGLTFQQLLDAYKHELFHYWSKPSPHCCLCNRRFTRVLYDRQWYSLFTNTSATHPHSSHDSCACPEQFIARAGISFEVCDVTLACTLITNITGTVTSSHVTGLLTTTPVTVPVLPGISISGILEYTIDRLTSFLGVNGFEVFLTKYKHDLFHSMEKRVCCQCTIDPDGKVAITPAEWGTLFDTSQTLCTSAVCSCQYSTKPGICRTSIRTSLLHKVGQSAGPLVTVRTVRNQLAHAASSTIDDPTFTDVWNKLTDVLNELIDIIPDATWRADMKSQISTLQTCPINGEMWEEYHRHLHLYLEVIVVKSPSKKVKGVYRNHPAFSCLSVCPGT